MKRSKISTNLEVPNSKLPVQYAKTSKQSTTNNQEKRSEVIINVAAAFGNQVAAKSKAITFKVTLTCTNEMFNVVNFPQNLKVRDLKSLLEFVCGIPYNLQRLSYLDEGELLDNKEVQYYDLIDGGLVTMSIWTIYNGLVKACVLGDLNEVLKQGISKDIEWHSSSSDYMFKKEKLNYMVERSGIALFIAAHRGNLNLVKSLITNGANINYQSSIGRTPLMVSVVANKTDVIDHLLLHNADIEICDLNGDSALTIAKKFNNKLGQHRLTQFKWKKRADVELKEKKSLNKDDDDLFPDKRLPHQVFDSSKKTWFKGNFMQIYMMHLVPMPEFSGGSLSAPRSVGKEVLKTHKMRRSNTDLKELKASLNENGEGTNEQTTQQPIFEPRGLSFDKWLAQKIKVKKNEQLLKRRKEESRLANIELKEQETKESNQGPTNQNDKNVWMRDYTKLSKTSNPEHLTLTSKKSSNQLANKFTESINSELTSNSMSRSRNFDVYNIYKGMTYEEWAKIRDDFVKSHNISTVTVESKDNF